MNPAPAKSILLVDDERSYTDLMTQLLSDYFACPVHSFTSPAAALDALPYLNPGVIATDYHMPDINGFELIRRAAPVAPEAAFLLITGHHIPSLEDEMAQLAPLKGYLAKPFRWKKLADEILRIWPAGSPPPAPRRPAA